MRKYIVKRLLLSVMILFCVSFIIYTLMRCLPGSFVETRAMQLSQGAGAKSIEVTDSNIKSFERVARKYNVDFAVKRDKTT